MVEIEIYGKKVPIWILAASATIFCIGLLFLFSAVRQRNRIRRALRTFQSFLSTHPDSGSHHQIGLTPTSVDKLTVDSDSLGPIEKSYWNLLFRTIQSYQNLSGQDGYFLTVQPRELLPFETAVGRYYNYTLYNAIPGVLTASGLALTFIAILIALYDVKYSVIPGSPEKVEGLGGLINGLSGKFVTSIAALLTTILYTLTERHLIRSLRDEYEAWIEDVENRLPTLTQAKLLLDIQQFSAKQTVSISNISSEVVDRFMGAFNSIVVPNLTDRTADKIAFQLQQEFRPTMQSMDATLEDLKGAIIRLESQKQDSISAELKGFFDNFQSSISRSLQNMGDQFHGALTGAANQEFGNVQKTMESTRKMLETTNNRFAEMQSAFSLVISQAEKSTSEQIQSASEQSAKMALLLESMLKEMRQASQENMSAVQKQMAVIVSDLSDKMARLSEGMVRATIQVTSASQDNSNSILEKSANWTKLSQERMDELIKKMELRSVDFTKASKTLLEAQSGFASVLEGNSEQIANLKQASSNLEATTSAMARQTAAVLSLQKSVADVSKQLSATSQALTSATETNYKSVEGYRQTLEQYGEIAKALDGKLADTLRTIRTGLEDYLKTMETNFINLANSTKPVFNDLATIIGTQTEALQGPLDELSAALTKATEKLNGKP